MAKVKVVAEQIMRILGKRTDDSDLDKREIILSIIQSSSVIIRNRALQEKYNSDDIMSSPDNNIYTFKNVEVQEDKECQSFFIDLPGNVVHLPNGAGIRMVSAMSSPDENYTPVSSGSTSLLSSLGLDCVLGIGYYLDGDRIMFTNMDNSNNPGKVIVKLVGALGPDSELPSDMEDEIIKNVLSIYQGYRPQDESNDQIDQI